MLRSIRLAVADPTMSFYVQGRLLLGELRGQYFDFRYKDAMNFAYQLMQDSALSMSRVHDKDQQ